MKNKTYCGIDLHKNFSAICLMNEEGLVLKEEKLYHNDGSFEEFFVKHEDLECAVETMDTWG